MWPFFKKKNQNSKKSKISNEFIEVTDIITKEIYSKIDGKKQRTLVLWLVSTPKNYFESLFINDNQIFTIDLIENAETIAGYECAYLTIAYTIWHLEQFLKNSKGYKESLGYTMNDIERLIKSINKHGDKILLCLELYRDRFSSNIDPRDWVIFFIRDITQLLVMDKKVIFELLHKWDSSILDKYKIITYDIQYFNGMKKTSIDIVQGG